MAQEAWKVLVQQRAKEAARRCARAHGPIAEVLGNLGMPDLVADVPAWLAWVPRAEVALADASRGLAVAASLMAAARFIAARGAAASPAPAAAPPRSIVGGGPGLPGDDELQRSGLSGLQDARAWAEKACDSVEVSRAHLSTIRLLLDHPHLPGIHDGLHILSDSVRQELDAAQKHEQDTISLAHGVCLL